MSQGDPFDPNDRDHTPGWVLAIVFALVVIGLATIFRETWNHFIT